MFIYSENVVFDQFPTVYVDLFHAAEKEPVYPPGYGSKLGTRQNRMVYPDGLDQERGLHYLMPMSIAKLLKNHQ